MSGIYRGNKVAMKASKESMHWIRKVHVVIRGDSTISQLQQQSFSLQFVLVDKTLWVRKI